MVVVASSITFFKVKHQLNFSVWWLSACVSVPLLFASSDVDTIKL